MAGLFRVAALVLVLLLVGGPATAARSGVAPDVLEDRVAWLAAEDAVAQAEAALAAAQGELRAAVAAAEDAARARESEAAALAARQREFERAVENELLAMRRLEHATAVRDDATAARDDAEVERDAKLGDHADVALTAYVKGPEELQVLSALVYAVDEAQSAGDFLAGLEHLERVTNATRGRVTLAEKHLTEREHQLDQATARLRQREQEQAAASAQRAAAAGAVDEQQARHDAAVATHEAAVAVVTQATALRDAAAGAVAGAEAVAAGALATLQRWGWRAGVPGDEGLTWPVDGDPTSGFGPRLHPVHGDVRMHHGIDVPAPTGQPVVAAADGRVVSAGDRGGYGLAVVIRHAGGQSTLYAHLSSISVRAGQDVGAAALIGAVGSTGTSTGSHLHFEIHERGQPRDPLRYF